MLLSHQLLNTVLLAVLLLEYHTVHGLPSLIESTDNKGAVGQFYSSRSTYDRNTGDIASKSYSVHKRRALNKLAKGPILNAQEKGLDLVAINELTGVSALHAEGNYGEGVKVGIVDSGIDYKHPALGGCFGDGCKVRYGHDFVNDDFPGKNKAMKSDPIDCSGHGTQVAGIIGAETDTFVGVAYKALLGAYRVMGCDRKAHIDIMMQGIKMAADDGMDVINVSMATLAINNQYKYKLELDRIARRGIIMVSGAGNNEPGGMWTAGRPAVLPSFIAVTGADFSTTPSRYFTINSKGQTESINYSSRCTNIAFPHKEAAIAMATLSSKLFNCRFNENIKGKVVLIMSNPCTTKQLLAAAENAGAFGLIMPVADNPKEKDYTCSIPLLEISPTDSQKINVAAKTPLSFQMSANIKTLKKNYQSDMFSAWGPTPWLSMGPEIAAPSIRILTTSIGGNSNYERIGGTSIASPYVAGVVALFLKEHGRANINIKQVRVALQSTAYPMASRTVSALESVARQGFGLINAYRAVKERVTFQPSVIELGDNAFRAKQPNGGTVHRINVNNQSNVERKYVLRYLPTASVRNYMPNGQKLSHPEQKAAYANVIIEPSSIIVPPMAVRPINVKITEPADAGLPINENWVYSGYIVAEPVATEDKSISDKAMTIPFFGLKGSINQLTPFIQKLVNLNNNV